MLLLQKAIIDTVCHLFSNSETELEFQTNQIEWFKSQSSVWETVRVMLTSSLNIVLISLMFHLCLFWPNSSANSSACKMTLNKLNKHGLYETWDFCLKVTLTTAYFYWERIRSRRVDVGLVECSFWVNNDRIIHTINAFFHSKTEVHKVSNKFFLSWLFLTRNTHFRIFLVLIYTIGLIVHNYFTSFQEEKCLPSKSFINVTFKFPQGSIPVLFTVPAILMN